MLGCTCSFQCRSQVPVVGIAYGRFGSETAIGTFCKFEHAIEAAGWALEGMCGIEGCWLWLVLSTRRVTGIHKLP